MPLTILSPGPLTTVQDEGRFGHLHAGIGRSGAMDARAYRAANALVGNARGEAVLEATLMGPTIRFEQACSIALTGADMSARLDGQPIPRYACVPVRAGQVLEMGFAAAGVRGYLAVRGGIDVPLALGSRSTNLKCQLGGWQGRRLAAGDVLPIGAQTPCQPPAAPMEPPEYPASITVRAVAGPQAEMFPPESLAAFFSQAFTISPDSDRMGIRLQGEPLASLAGTDIVSDGIVFGAVQVPGNGLPIVLMADHQTTGGYAKIATVVADDLPLLAQARPGTAVRFSPVRVEEIQAAAQTNLLRKWKEALLYAIRH